MIICVVLGLKWNSALGYYWKHTVVLEIWVKNSAKPGFPCLSWFVTLQNQYSVRNNLCFVPTDTVDTIFSFKSQNSFFLRWLDLLKMFFLALLSLRLSLEVLGQWWQSEQSSPTSNFCGSKTSVLILVGKSYPLKVPLLMHGATRPKGGILQNMKW